MVPDKHSVPIITVLVALLIATSLPIINILYTWHHDACSDEQFLTISIHDYLFWLGIAQINILFLCCIQTLTLYTSFQGDYPRLSMAWNILYAIVMMLGVAFFLTWFVIGIALLFVKDFECLSSGQYMSAIAVVNWLFCLVEMAGCIVCCHATVTVCLQEDNSSGQ